MNNRNQERLDLGAIESTARRARLSVGPRKKSSKLRFFFIILTIATLIAAVAIPTWLSYNGQLKVPQWLSYSYHQQKIVGYFHRKLAIPFMASLKSDKKEVAPKVAEAAEPKKEPEVKPKAEPRKEMASKKPAVEVAPSPTLNSSRFLKDKVGEAPTKDLPKAEPVAIAKVVKPEAKGAAVEQPKKLDNNGLAALPERKLGGNEIVSITEAIVKTEKPAPQMLIPPDQLEVFKKQQKAHEAEKINLDNPPTVASKEKKHRFVLKLNMTSQQGEFWKDGALVRGPFPISSGGPATLSEAGEYSITSMKVDDKSTELGNAPMPYCMRLYSPSSKRQGVGFHAGKLYGYNSSHGCFRGPEEEVRAIFNELQPYWQKDHGCVSVYVSGSAKNLFREKYGSLLVYDGNDNPIAFRREGGKLPDEFYDALRNRKVTLFCEDAYGNFSMNRRDWFFSFEPIRQKVKVYVTEVEEKLGPLTIGEEGLHKLYAQQKLRLAQEAKNRTKKG